MKRERVEQLVRAMVNASHTEEEIAEELDMSKSYIHKVKRKLGMTEKRRSPKDDAQTIVEMFKQGRDKAEIADKLGWAKGTINSILRENGFGKPVTIEEPPVIVPVRKVIKPEIVIDNSNGKIYYDVTPFFLESEGMSIWST